ncbi:hypothetical protein JQK87_28630 [Streptomyces sp. G44]|uniref:DUF6479 family protein n=1 Tax=Streptomyces sp. G44 TaxID=2807632 RepID=UPI00195FD2AF|nr:DUF6479 family protein [Streptomyces sp. G44]MBM7172287.1 hypothetical protein [Streptomyces sp. G44]
MTAPKSDLSVEQLAASPPLGGLLPFLAGLCIAALLVWAVWFGVRVRNREQVPPRAEDQPRPPAGGPVGHLEENREPDEVPRGGGRLTPHELKGMGTTSSKRSGDQRRRRWAPGGGGFGSGGDGKR